MGLISNGTTIFDAGALDSGLAKGAMTFMKKLTASSSATLSFVHGSGGVDFSTYKEYMFTFKNIHGATEDAEFNFQGSIDAGSNYNVAITSTAFQANHTEDNSGVYGPAYNGTWDLAQGTGYQTLFNNLDADNDECLGGSLHLFNPSDTTFVKHFISRISGVTSADTAQDDYRAGYFNTTSDIDAIQFKMSSGNIDAGDICLYGIA